MSFSVAVAGATGYAGGEVLRLLLAHDDAEIGALTAHSSAGTTLGEHHPHLWPLAGRPVVATDPAVLAGHDVVVLALPHGASGEVTGALDALGYAGIVVDCGADHRLTDPEAWRRFYGTEHADAWTYGLPELLRHGGDAPEAVATRQRADLAATRTIAVPGCNVTAITLALQPGVAAGVVDPGDVVATLAVGYTGAGKALKPHLLASEALGNLAPYSVAGTHRHIPEVIQNLALAAGTEPASVGLSLTPILTPTARGILASVTAPLAPALRGRAPEQARRAVREAWEETYAAEPLVRLLPPGTWPTVAMVAGSAAAAVQVDLDADAGPRDEDGRPTGRVVAQCALDNLGKGTAAAALQSLNLALGLPETRGLTTVGVAL